MAEVSKQYPQVWGTRPKFDTHTGASPGSSGRGMIQAIVPELSHNPQHLPALNS
jgi:hypothetical protein